VFFTGAIIGMVVATTSFFSSFLGFASDLRDEDLPFLELTDGDLSTKGFFCSFNGFDAGYLAGFAGVFFD